MKQPNKKSALNRATATMIFFIITFSGLTVLAGAIAYLIVNFVIIQ